jgi:hypothetical protein
MKTPIYHERLSSIKYVIQITKDLKFSKRRPFNITNKRTMKASVQVREEMYKFKALEPVEH